jgi:hypothetical protein
VFTLKEIVLPRFTLMSVAKPWIVASPAPLMSHSEDGLPARQFSATIAFGGEVQGLGVEVVVGVAVGVDVVVDVGVAVAVAAVVVGVAVAAGTVAVLVGVAVGVPVTVSVAVGTAVPVALAVAVAVGGVELVLYTRSTQ